MKVRKEITIALENAPGRLGCLCECLASEKVNIIAISVVDAANVGLVRLVVDKPGVVTKMINTSCPLTMSTTDVLDLSAPNKPGVLAMIANRLGKKGINIDYVYGSTARGGKAAIILRPSNLKKAMKLLRGM
jgi:hypothetical protein